MSVAGRFEILSPVFSGAVVTSTARDSHTGETVLLHYLPADRRGDPAELFRELAPTCPGQVLASGVDKGRPYVVTDYPRDRKAFSLWIRQLSMLGAATAKAAAAEPPAPLAPPPSAAEVPAGATRMFDPAAIFGGSAPPPGAPKPAAPPAEASADATRMFDPAAIFGAVPAKPKQEPQAPAADSGATRMFDPAAIFGGTVAKPKEASPAPAADGATRMFDPAALYGAAVPSAPEGISTVKLPRVPDEPDSSAKPESPSSAETKMFYSQDLAHYLGGGSSSTSHAKDAKAENSKHTPPSKDRSR